MNPQNSLHDAARFAVSEDCSGAMVRFGWRSTAIQVLEISRDGFTLAANASLGNYLKKGRSVQLDYRGESSLVTLESLTGPDTHEDRIHVVRLCDVTKTKVPSSSGLSFLRGNSKVQPQDPTLPIGVVFGILLILLITPGWGDDLGTSVYLTDFIQALVSSIREIVSGS